MAGDNDDMCTSCTNMAQSCSSLAYSEGGEDDAHEGSGGGGDGTEEDSDDRAVVQCSRSLCNNE